jgi:hypothetical protein
MVMPLTAIKAAREVDSTRLLVVAMTDSATEASRVTPHHLREVTPGIVEMRVVVWVLGLFLVPAVGGGAGELNPRIIVERGGRDGREVASRTFLTISTVIHQSVLRHKTYMSGRLGALFDIGSGSVCKLGVPYELYGAVKLSPVPVSTHHGADEVGVILVRSSIVNEVTRLNFVSWGSNRSSGGKSEKRSKDPHGGLLM